MVAKKFVAVRRRYGTKGSPIQYDYIYKVGGQEVSVDVHAIVLNRWNVIASDIKQAVELFIETRMEEGWSPGETKHLLLDEFSAMPIAQRLGWKPNRR